MTMHMTNEPVADRHRSMLLINQALGYLLRDPQSMEAQAARVIGAEFKSLSALAAVGDAYLHWAGYKGAPTDDVDELREKLLKKVDALRASGG